METPRITWILLAAVVLTLSSCRAPQKQVSAKPVAEQSVWLEDHTWNEVRDSIQAGTTRVLVPTGGVEQNGTHVVLGKHNMICEMVCERLARKLGRTMVAPVIKFVPEGNLDPPDGHMLYPGTISVRPATFHALLVDVVTSLKLHGFHEVILLGDSGGNQEVLAQVASELGARWPDCKVRYISEFYNYGDLREWLLAQGYSELPMTEHEELVFSAQLAVIDPEAVRYRARSQNGAVTINGVTFDSPADLKELGEKLVERRVERTALAITR